MELTNGFDFNDFPRRLQFLHDTVNRLVGDQNQVRPWSPAVDILETENALIFKADVPDVNPKDIDIQLGNGRLTLKGDRKFEKVDKVQGCHRAERRYGVFARSFTLPDTVDPEGVRADYAHGVLTITLPKKELVKPRAIKVNVN